MENLSQFAAFFVLNVLRVLKYAILARVLVSWIQPNPHAGGRFVRVLHEVTDPLLRPIRSITPRIGMIDLSPLLAFFLLDLAQFGLMAAL